MIVSIGSGILFEDLVVEVAYAEGVLYFENAEDEVPVGPDEVVVVACELGS